MDPLDSRVAQLEAELSAARRTLEVLTVQVERGGASQTADRFSLHKTISGLEHEVAQGAHALKGSESRYRALYDNSPDAILTLDGECRLIDCNRTAEVVFGRGADEMRGAPVAGLMNPDSGAALTGLLWTDFVGIGDSEVRLPDGRAMTFSVARTAHGETLLALRDVSQSHRFDQEVVSARRLASVGGLAAGLAHEINNPLAVLQGRIELMESLPGAADAKMSRQITVIRESCRRIAALVRNLQTYAVPRALQSDRHRLAIVLDAARAAAGGRLDRVRLEVELTPSNLQVYGDEALLVQLLSNLLVHAAGASPSRGRVRFEASEDGSRGVQITIEDDGPGMPEEALRELRSPASNVGRASETTLGFRLATVWAIAQDHGGWLTVENRKPTGALYHVRLPPARAKPRKRKRSATGKRRGLEILVVDDDQLLCETVGWMLSADGHRIAAVHSAEEALVRLSRATFDVVLTDIRLPGMDGEELLVALQQRWPALARRTLLTSGLLHTPRRMQRYLQKPFTRAQLLAAIQDASEG